MANRVPIQVIDIAGNIAGNEDIWAAWGKKNPGSGRAYEPLALKFHEEHTPPCEVSGGELGRWLEKEGKLVVPPATTRIDSAEHQYYINKRNFWRNAVNKGALCLGNIAFGIDPIGIGLYAVRYNTHHLASIKSQKKILSIAKTKLKQNKARLRARPYNELPSPERAISRLTYGIEKALYQSLTNVVQVSIEQVIDLSLACKDIIASGVLPKDSKVPFLAEEVANKELEYRAMIDAYKKKAA